MRLSALVSQLTGDLAPRRSIPTEDDHDPVIHGITYDSRAVSPGDAFFALRGADVDGHDYLEQALALGAEAVFVEELPAELALRGRAAVILPDARRALAPVARHFFGAPADELSLIGVTGTNGKTSTTYLIESMLEAAGRPIGLIGTVEIRYAGERRRATNTTPESLDLQRTLRDMRTRGVEVGVMEVSSHGLELGRVAGCDFSVAAFTNLTQDHLDFHGSMEAYLDSKLRLFRDHLAEDGVGVVNLDDPAADHFVRTCNERGARCVGVSRRDRADAQVVLLACEVGLDGTRARLRLPQGVVDIELPLVGDFNLENLLVAAGIGVAAGLESEFIVRGAERCPQVPGRAERVGADLPNRPTVIIDYAHTPDAVEKLLAAVRPLCQGRLVAVFGCGGDRDRAKRPLMAEAVARHADRIVATSDNPRTEDPEQILDDVEGGLGERKRVDPGDFEAADRGYLRVVDRREAIAIAIRAARAGDTVVIAGKGHEDYQIIGRERFPFSDTAEALRALGDEAAA
jgi:UDP-N-acetylmuramoyl-L-alanyl-D-glutamate--2,6-diaminopimelate ligase